VIAGVAVPVLLISAGVGLAQTVDTTLWVTNGSVSALVRDGGTIYIGGAFSQVGPATGGGLAIDASTGAAQQPYPKAAGGVFAVAPDGIGGWYLGGNFTAVRGQPRNGLAHLDAGGNLTAWNPNANGTVRALAVSGGTVYVGGSFTSIGGQPRNRIAAIDAATGSATAWNPDASSVVQALAVSGSTIYVGGWYTTIGGQPRSRIAALDAVTGNATAWNPNANNIVSALLVDLSSNTVYAGGEFTSIGGQARNRIAAVDKTSGAATAWNPNADNSVLSLGVRAGTVYASGFFTNIGGQPRNYIAALDAASGAATAWNPSSNSGSIFALAVSGSTIYAGGYYTTIGGQPRNYIAALDAATGNATAWNPSLNLEVRALAVSGGTVYAGGNFTSIGGVLRNRIAALDATSGAATAWNPNASSTVRALAVSGGTVYAGGHFTSIGGQPRNYIGALDAASGAATAWNPNADNLVYALAVSGGTVYAGGRFLNIGGATRSNIAALDASSGFATPWSPNASNMVYALAVSPGTVYAGGAFANIGGQARSRIAALDAASGGATAWNPIASDTVRALAVSGGMVYAGGDFGSIGGQPRSHIAALDAASGAATAWNPIASNPVRALAVSGGTVYAGGDFTSIGGQPRNNIAALDAASGTATAWDPNAGGLLSPQVHALAVSGGTVYAGGDFIRIGVWPQSRIMAITEDQTVTCDGFEPAIVTDAIEHGQYLAAGDVNEDGILDLLVQHFSLTIVMPGQGSGGVGNGTFGVGQFWSGGGNLKADLVDLNDDGILDFVGARTTGVVVRLGLGSGGVGNGTFGSETLYPTVFGIAMATGDFNEDGIVDVAWADAQGANPDEVQIRLGQGSGGVGAGTFSAPVPVYVTTGAISDLDAGDFNEDGITDLVVGHGQSLRVLLGGGSAGKGNGTFTQGQLLVLTPLYPPLQGTTVTGDFNEDGITDLAGVPSGGTTGLMVLLGQGSGGVGNGTFAAPVVYAVGTDPRALQIADFTGDGIADAAVSLFGEGKVALLPGQGSAGVGDGTFGPPVKYGARGNEAWGLVAGDFVEDGTPDVAVTAHDSIRVSVLPWPCASLAPVGVAVTAPNGGEQWAVGNEQAITWTRGNGVIAVDVEVSRDGGANWETVAAGQTGTSFTWSVTGPATGTARVRVTDATVASRTDASNFNFGIGQPPVAVRPEPLGRTLLSPPYPNPFTEMVAAELVLSDEAAVVAEVCDLNGRRMALLADRRFPAGRHHLVWDVARIGRPVPLGVYFLRVRAGGFHEVRRIARIR
jgi:hypothetical protein